MKPTLLSPGATTVAGESQEAFGAEASFDPFHFDWDSEDLQRLAAKLRAIPWFGFTGPQEIKNNP
jgi:hypothetical protein